MDIAPPTTNEYAGQAARGFFQVLEAISQAVPIPAFGAAVQVAANIIKACDVSIYKPFRTFCHLLSIQKQDTQVTLERAEDLKVRIKTLVAVFVNELKGKKEEEIHDKLIKDIDTFNKFVQAPYFFCFKLRTLASGIWSTLRISLTKLHHNIAFF